MTTTNVQLALANLQAALALGSVLAPALGPKGQVAFIVAQSAINAIQTSQNAGTDVTDEQLQAVFDQYDRNEADDLLAQQEATAEQGSLLATDPADPPDQHPV